MPNEEIPKLEYRVLPLERVQVKSIDPKDRTRCRIRLQNRSYETSHRFWTSFFSRFGFSDSMFKYFGHQEVFDRICKLQPSTELRFCASEGSMLAVSNPGRPVANPNKLLELVKKFGGSDISYHDGVVTSSHTPDSGKRDCKIGPDSFYNRFVLETPVDGYGNPSTYLALWREICSNGAVAMTPTFRSEIVSGNDPIYNIARTLDTFDSDDGFAALRQRFQTAQISPASLWECLRLFRVLRTTGDSESVKSYEKVVGDIYNVYGVANLDGISSKKLRLLPAKCKMYDLLNLASEIATHRAKAQNALKLQSWIGTTVSDEYDLEGTSPKAGDFEETFLPQKKYQKRNMN